VTDTSNFAEAALKFIKEIEQFKNTWDSLLTVVMAVRTKDKWLNLCTIIRLSASSIKEKKKRSCLKSKTKS